jgi:hypothetical protein
MAQEIVKPTATALTTTEKNVYERYADAANANRILGDILKFSKGEWLAGRDGIEIPMGTKLVAGVDTTQVGWIRWVDLKPSEAVMGKLADGFVPCRRSELGGDDPATWPIDDNGTHRDPWQFSNLMMLMSAAGQIYSYPTASKGGIGAVGKLSGSYGKHMRAAPDELPVVALECDSYKHPNKQFGKIFTPVFKVVGWTDRKKFDAALLKAIERSEEEPEVEEEAPAAKTSGKGKKGNAYAAAKNKPYAGEGEDIPF